MLPVEVKDKIRRRARRILNSGCAMTLEEVRKIVKHRILSVYANSVVFRMHGRCVKARWDKLGRIYIKDVGPNSYGCMCRHAPPYIKRVGQECVWNT